MAENDIVVRIVSSQETGPKVVGVETSVGELLELLDLQEGHTALVNGQVVPDDTILRDGDRIVIEAKNIKGE
jgi:sulfur carrier protein ThiS